MSVKVGQEPDVLNNKKPKDSSFRQQTMKAYKPVPTVKSASIIFTVLGIIFIIVGAVLVGFSQEIIEYQQRYDNNSDCWKNFVVEDSVTCTVTFTVKTKMVQPVYFYYQLNNFYQNHRRYVKSKSPEQLNGKIMSKSDLQSECDPVVTMHDLGKSPKVLNSYLGTVYNSASIAANPCGLIAQTFFNDTFSMDNGTSITINENDIAWPSDKQKKFSNASNTQLQWTDVTNGNL